MNSQLTAIARNCLNAAYDKTMDFPAIIGTLLSSGFEGYLVDYRAGTTTYYLSVGDSVVLENRPSVGIVAPVFDQAGIVGQIRWAQANPPDYNYTDFCNNAKALGCAGYIVSFPGRRVVYFGRTAEMHIEYFP